MKTTFAILTAVMMICGFASPAEATEYNIWLEAFDNAFWPEDDVSVPDELQFTVNYVNDIGEEEWGAGPVMENSLPGPIYYRIEDDAEFGLGGEYEGAEGFNVEYHNPFELWEPEPLEENPRGPKEFDHPFNHTDPQEWLFDGQ